MEVLAEADNGRAVLELVKKLSPHLVIMDISMPDLNGMEATQQIQAEFPGVKVIALSMHSDSLFVLNMLKAGASGYLLKDCAVEELVKAIRAVVSHKTYLSPGVSDIVIRDFVSGWSTIQPPALAVLTPKEQEVLQLLTQGHNPHQIAGALEISPKTVEAHRKQLMSKLGIQNLDELTRYAVREGVASYKP